jgi:leucyl/phenylalanyl-tRNA--protein transferase
VVVSGSARSALASGVPSLAQPDARLACPRLQPARGSRFQRRGQRLRGTAQHARGWAHSYENWRGDALVGGLYGVRLGRVFFGESMFSREPDASKAALAGLVARSGALGIELIDCQLPSAHLRSLGSRPIPRQEFLAVLA